MGGGHYWLSSLGGFLIWTLKCFKGTFEESRKNKYSFILGITMIFLIVLIVKFVLT